MEIPEGARVGPSNEGAVIHDSSGYDTYLRLENTAGAPGLVKVGAGSMQITLTVGAGTTGVLGPFDATPYVDAGGDLRIDFEGFEGVVRACQAPRI